MTMHSLATLSFEMGLLAATEHPPFTYKSRKARMHVRIIEFKLGPGTRQTAERVADELSRFCPSLHGFESVSFFADFETGDYGSYSVWQTQDDADKAADTFMPDLQRRLGSLLKATPVMRSLELYVPRI